MVYQNTADACPSCHHTDHTKVAPNRFLAFTQDRLCHHCGTRYTPPTPWWAGPVSVICGIGGAAFAAWYVRYEMSQSSSGRIPPGGIWIGIFSLLAIAMGFKLIWESLYRRKLDKQNAVTKDEARMQSAELLEESHDAKKTGQVAKPARNSSSFGGFMYAFLKEFLLRAAAIPFLGGALLLGGFAGGYCYHSIVPQPDISANDINDDAKVEAWRKKSESWDNGSMMAMLAGVVLTVTPTFLVWRRFYSHFKDV